MNKLKIAIYTFITLLLFLNALVLGPMISLAQEQATPENVKAVFVGYEGNDLVFHISNLFSSPIEIKGLAFRRQILYRPLEKGVVVKSIIEGEPFREVKFRSNGDYIWSENHMSKFQLVFRDVDSNTKGYVRISPKIEGLE